MAIAKMKKIMLIAPNRIQNELMDAVQELQTLELISLSEGKELLQERPLPEQKAVNQLQQQFDRLTSNLQFMMNYQKEVSLLTKLRTKKEQFTVRELQQEVSQWKMEEILKQVESYQHQLKHVEEEYHVAREKELLLRKWSFLAFHPKEIFKHPFTKTKMGVLPQTVDNSYLNSLKESSVVVVKEIYHTREEIGVLVTYPRSHQQEAKKELADAHFSVVWYPYDEAPKQELEENLKKQQMLLSQKQTLQKQLQEEVELVRQLQLMSEWTYNELQRELAKKQLYSGEHLFCLHGYVTQEAIQAIQRQLQQQQLSSQITVVELDIAKEEYSDVPIVLKNHPLIAPFESLIEMYGLPKYGEMDPTAATAPFYLLFFGMMAGDLGYGAVLWLGTFIGLKFFYLEKETKKNLLMFHFLSYSTMMWGIIFGSFFGVDLPFHILSLTKDLTSIMVLSVVFGVLQVLFGLLLGAYGNVKRKAYADAYTNHIGWLAIIFGLLLYGSGGMIFNNPVITLIGKYVAMIAAILIVVITMLTSSNKFGGLASGLYNLYGISGYIGDFVSYTRLMALAVSGGSIASAFNMLVGFLPPLIRFTLGIVLMIGLHGLNIFLSFLGAYVHGLRLQFVEFFAKFYEGGGRQLQPFKTYEKYIETKQEINK